MSTEKDWKELMLAEYAQGASDAEVVSILQITRRKFDQLIEQSEYNRELVEFGRDLAKAFWYKVGRENLKNQKFNTSLWYANMKNRFGWSDRVSTEDRTPVQEKSDDELREELRAYVKKFEKHDEGASGGKRAELRSV